MKYLGLVLLCSSVCTWCAAQPMDFSFTLAWNAGTADTGTWHRPIKRYLPYSDIPVARPFAYFLWTALQNGTSLYADAACQRVFTEKERQAFFEVMRREKYYDAQLTLRDSSVRTSLLPSDFTRYVWHGQLEAAPSWEVRPVSMGLYVGEEKTPRGYIKLETQNLADSAYYFVEEVELRWDKSILPPHCIEKVCASAQKNAENAWENPPHQKQNKQANLSFLFEGGAIHRTMTHPQTGATYEEIVEIPALQPQQIEGLKCLIHWSYAPNTGTCRAVVHALAPYKWRTHKGKKVVQTLFWWLPE